MVRMKSSDFESLHITPLPITRHCIYFTSIYRNPSLLCHQFALTSQPSDDMFIQSLFTRLDYYKSANNMYKSFLSVWVQFMCGYFQTKNIFCISSYVQDRTIWSSNDLDITDLLLLVSEDITHPIYTFVSQVAQLLRAHTPDMYAYWLISSLDSCTHL